MPRKPFRGRTKKITVQRSPYEVSNEKPNPKKRLIEVDLRRLPRKEPSSWDFVREKVWDEINRAHPEWSNAQKIEEFRKRALEHLKVERLLEEERERRKQGKSK